MKIMVLIAHPNLENSMLNAALALELKKYKDIYVRDLYKEYPNWNIDVEREQKLLLEADRVVLQFPLYWYSSPPLLKKWFDDVLTPGWAYGPGGNHLEGKEFMVATTTAGPENEYRAGGRNAFTISEFFRPIQSTFLHCKGIFLPSFVSFNPSPADLPQEAVRYAAHIQSPINSLSH